MELLELLQDCCYGTKLAIKRKSKTINKAEKRTTAIRWERSSTCRGCSSLWKQCLVTAAPSNHKAVSITDALWETADSLFPETYTEWMKRDTVPRTVADHDNPPATILTLASVGKLVEVPTLCSDALLAQGFAADPSWHRSWSPAWLGPAGAGKCGCAGQLQLAPETLICAKPQGGSKHQSA